MSKYQALIDALKAGPTAYARKWHVDGVEPKKELNQNGRWAWPAKFKFSPVTQNACAKDDVALWAVDLPALLADLERAEKALSELLACGGVIADAEDHELRAAIQDQGAEQIVKVQAFAVLNARAALSQLKGVQ